MIGTIVYIGVNTGAFYGISKVLPGFKVKDEKTALIMAVAFSILGTIAGLFVLPFAAIIGIFCAFLAFIPFIGPLLAASAILLSTFILVFTVAFALLVIIDKVMDDFEMGSFSVAVVAAFLLGIINVGIRLVLPN